MSTKVNNRAWLLVGGSVLITFVMTVAGCERKPRLFRRRAGSADHENAGAVSA